MVWIICSESELEPATDRCNHSSTNEILRIILLDVTTVKHGIIRTENKTVERGITKNSTNKQRRALGGSKEERFRTAIDDIEEVVKIGN